MNTFSEQKDDISVKYYESEFGKEVFLTYNKITVWIAPDEILINGDNIDKRFEKYAFNSIDELINEAMTYLGGCS